MISSGKVEGPCQGDSGGPLFTTGKPHILIGIVSLGVGCLDPRFPPVFTRVSSFNNFIRMVTQ